MDGRPKLEVAIRFARSCDGLLVTLLDRQAQSAVDLHSISKELEAKGVDVIATEPSIDTTTPNKPPDVQHAGRHRRVRDGLT
ncbi:recombinase family protein [Devosia sp. WQ 349K1]|uniref:recombinase family protein n=1 Tax=Devosia sp. WQ 349K1 TaxID=2800329 RepID=UPI001AED29A5